jgi:uncharacterized protein
MLIRLTIENFRSIKNEQVLSFEAIKDRRLRDDHVISVDPKTQILKFCAVIGANGSGKSTVIRAVEVLQAMVLETEMDTNVLLRLAGSSFAYDAKSRSEPSRITVEITEGTDPESGSPLIYTYTLEADTEKVHSELLSITVGRSTRRLFERVLADQSPEDDLPTYTYRWGKRYTGLKKRFAKKVPHNRLFLGDAARAGSESLQPMYRWFSDQLCMIPIGLSQMSEQFVIDHLKRTPEMSAYLLNFLRDMDLIDIKELRIAEKEQEPDRLIYIHGVDRSQYASYFSSESLGTRRLTMLAVVYYLAAQQTMCLVADDFGILLHDKIVSELYQKFTCVTASNASQLVGSGVNLTILNHDLLRHDEIWLTSKYADGSTAYNCLADYVIRKHDDVREMYMHGAFGSVPIVSESTHTTREEV